MMKLSKVYNPKQVEDKIYKLWLRSGFFNPDKLPKKHKKPYTIVIPPPNVTGELHIGHALNAVIQDILIRQKRMQGFKTLWLPGTDHAGIATQNVVEKKLKKEGKTRFDLGREKFTEEIWKWKEKYGNIILEQFKKMGCSCDWSRTRFTMDEDYSQAVKEAFSHYYKKGWIYKGKRVVNWCPRCATSLSDLELEYQEEKGNLWYIKYGKNITVATTRPETMLGDTAVAVNPRDKRYKDLIGEKVILPLVGREIPIIADRLVDPKFGTGTIKITPAHDLTDYQIGQNHNLASIQVIDEKGKITKEAPLPYQGLKVLEARKKIVEDLEKQGLLEKIEDYIHQVPKCYRCGATIELIPSQQWFLKMKELAKLAQAPVKEGKIKFHPKNFEKPYFDWLKNIRDWCISRQIWWGHKIPIEGEKDVLDTWFSSALWPFAILGYPKKTKDLKTFYPTDVLSTARDIINLWVARMIFSGMEFMEKIPFKDVYIHATILTRKGKRMSKSLGTGINPINLIEQYGADATRFGIAYQIMGNQDIRFVEDNIVMGKKFCNKIWNASRFVLGQIKNSKFKIDSKLKIQNSKLTIADKKILKQLDKTIKSVNKDLEQFKFGKAAHTLYNFFWHDFCDIYIEESKKQNDKKTKEILFYVLVNSLKLFHPFMPFITEEIYQKMPVKNKKKCLIIETWPQI
ncbi:MAG: valine--tRNA ligase [Candidatus Nealsonbacteria bacterium CG10_big_fil_rev_8_21_14_0_10_36_24]|uniref:Valine--tRNA ligase n=2 Tax=Candidatus Nealsoniibacteriota TaxID=1817911 RepID=A0A2H0YNE7_9BACT|nr:MAG: valine--tRNA ligase [Candidatus Nealsonbacteria bacterium CG10_big_fil_rev_8_21_14_0_10_36_24]PIS39946.1 MAG: valine--tRNA ligase [Candidatus Nealsonbacteria bacterium CG08_land_8_20_14_0_20_36_22]